MANGLISQKSRGTIRDPAMLDVTVRLDTSKWSTRKKNLVVRCIKTGVLDAGLTTNELVRDIMASNGLPVFAERGQYWGGDTSLLVEKSAVRAEQFDDLQAAAVAGIKMRDVAGQKTSAVEQAYLRWVVGDHSMRWYRLDFEDRILVPNTLPLDDWLSDDPKTEDRANLCQMVQDGKTITAIYEPEKEMN